MAKKEQDKLFEVVQQAFTSQIIDDRSCNEALVAYSYEMDQQSPDKDSMLANFEKMRRHFNCLSEIETTHGALTDPERLREVLKQNSFLLGLESKKIKSLEQQIDFLKIDHQRLLHEKTELLTKKMSQETELKKVNDKLYDIDRDFY